MHDGAALAPSRFQAACLQQLTHAWHICLVPACWHQVAVREHSLTSSLAPVLQHC